VRSPLAAFLPVLDENHGAVVTISSSFVEDAPAGFAAYVALKLAVEGLARTASREARSVFWLTVRPPRLQTAWNDTPTGVLGAIPADRVASHVANHLAESWRGHAGTLEVLHEFPEFAAPVVVAEVDPEFTALLSSTFTAEPVAHGLRFWFKELGIPADVEVAPYGQVLQTLLNPAVGAPKRGINAVLLRVRDWLRELAPEQAASVEFVSQYLDKTARDFERAMRAHRAHAAAETLLIVCPSGTSDTPDIDALVDRTERWILEWVSGVPGLEVVAAADFHDDYAVEPADLADPLREHIAHIPYKDAYLYVLSTLVMRHAHRKLAPVRKVVVVDCDHTLWRGVVGEAGADAIEFDEAHRALHQRLAALSANGMLVCLCSKNEEDDVWRVFDTRRDLLLPRDQIVAAAINWQPKSENLRRLASRLNVGLDSFVFLDDNPVECAEVRAGCPEVLTLQWPTAANEAIQLLRHTWELQPRKGTTEDARRTEMYREEFKRQELLEGTLSFRDFLNGLDLTVDARPLDEDDLKRASQLTLRTNQFNFTTRRRNEAEMQALLSGGEHIIRTVRVRDRFGDYGLVGLFVAAPRGDMLDVDTFLLSCRVLGRGVEHHLTAELGRIAQEQGLRAVRMRVEPTKRNTPARKFLDSIAPAEYRTGAEGALECELPAEWLAALRFEPGDAPAETYAETETASASPVASDTSRQRTRETQVVRAAAVLGSAAGLLSAVDAKPAAAATPAGPSSENASTIVYEAFAAALALPIGRVREIDRLESLGCDSFKIVEITVALTQKFPWLPGTLLFEHRSVSEIVREVTALARERQTPDAASAAPVITARGPEIIGSEIAVVGMHVRCAGARSAADLWTLLHGGSSAVVPVPEDRQHFLHRLDDSRPHWAGLLDDVDRFDAELFGVAPREAEIMDPQLRLFLEVAWGALEDAGCLGADHDIATGVFVGVMYGDYGYRANLAAQERGTPYRCWEGFSLANRLSQLLGFRGPSLAVDTACSSSGTALHLATRSLAAGDCNVAVVGGVNLILDPDRFVHLGRLGILSHNGRCLAFGAEADGTVLGEGAGAVVLRRLTDAKQRGDRILGIIKGTGMSTGSGTVGFTAPNPVAQAEAIRRALQAAGVDPRTISYIETHGTGTALGDPIEVRGLTLAHSTPALLDPALDGPARCGIGSIKPNIGHLEAGAGVLGLIKVLLQLQHKTLLPSITSEEPNPQIPFDQTPFYVQRAAAPWTRPVLTRDRKPLELPRRAGLSSFGVGGSNAHVIVEEAPERSAPSAAVDRPLHVLALSGHTREALRARAGEAAAWLEAGVEVPLADACFSVNTGRRHLQHRASVVASARDAAVEELREIASGRKPSSASRKPKIAFLFTGQGSQYASMGRDLYETQPVFREALDRCAIIFDRLLDRPLLDLLFADEGSDEARLLNQTGYTQPALFAFEYALAQLWRSWGVVPDVVMGHSVGEIAAMCVAGGISLDDGLELIASRGRLMQALPAGGAMTSVMAGEARVAEAIAGHEREVSIAAINGPSQTVISGVDTVVNAIAQRLSAEGVKTRSLVVSHAFHSPLMTPIADEYAAVVNRIKFSTPRIPLVGGVHGRAAGEEITQASYWIGNALQPVRFADGMRTLEGEGITAYIEIGPQPVLIGMGRTCITDEDGALWLGSLRKDAKAWATLASSVSELYAAGGEIDWKAFDAPYARRRATAPAYPFGGRRYWISDGPGVRPAADASTAAAATPANAQAYTLAWHPAPALTAPAAAPGVWLVLADTEGFGSTLVGALEDLGGRCSVVFAGDRFVDAGQGRYQADPSSAADLERIVDAAGDVRGIIDLWSLDAPATDSSVSSAHGHIERAIRTGRMALRGGSSRKTRLWLVTRNAVPAGTDDRALCVSQAPLWGLGRTLALEHPDHWGGLIDLPAGAGPRDAAVVAAEVVAAGVEDQVAVRNGQRFVPRLVPASPDPAHEVRFDGDSIHLITGAFGAIGRQLSQWLVARGARHLALTGRRGSATPGAADVIRDLESRGAKVHAIAGDVARAEDVERIFNQLAQSGLPLGAVFHAAGVDRPKPFGELDAAQTRDVLEPKIDGASLLDEHSRRAGATHFVCFSSISSVLGAAGRAHYAAANAFLDALAHDRRRRGLPALSVNWGPWSGGGIATEDVLRQFERIGNYGLDPAQALGQLERLMQSNQPQVSVASIDWAKFRMAYEARGPKPILAQVAPDAATAAASTDLPPWIEALTGVPQPRRERELAAMLQREVADTLGFENADSVALDRTFQDMGMDSLMSAEFARRLNKQLGIRSTALVFQHPTAGALARALVEQVNSATVATAAAASPSPAVAAASAAIAAEAAAVAANPIAGYSPETEPLVFAFQRQAWPNRSEELIGPRWRWMFVDSAKRLGLEPRVWLYRDNGRVVGHNGAIPVRLKVGSEEIDTAWLVDTMVLEEFRSQAVGSRLMLQSDQDLPFALSLGQTSQMREIQLRLGWEQVAPLQTAQLLIRPERVLKGKLPGPAATAAGLGLRAAFAVRDAFKSRAKARVREIARFDAGHDALWARMAATVACTVKRDASYLNWKYVDQPGQQFVRLEVRDEADALQAVVVWALREPDQAYAYRRALLVDFVAPLDNASRLAQAIDATIPNIADRGADAALCLHINETVTRALRECGFHLREPGRFLLVSPGPLQGAQRASVLSSAAWLVTQGDSDIDRPW
jgi:FkbH-like protein